MKALQRIGVTSLAAALSAGATVVAGGAALAQGDDNRVAYVKLEDSGNAWVMSTDDDRRAQQWHRGTEAVLSFQSAELCESLLHRGRDVVIDAGGLDQVGGEPGTGQRKCRQHDDSGGNPGANRPESGQDAAAVP